MRQKLKSKLVPDRGISTNVTKEAESKTDKNINRFQAAEKNASLLKGEPGLPMIGSVTFQLIIEANSV
jgi:hypothetical protein